MIRSRVILIEPNEKKNSFAGAVRLLIIPVPSAIRWISQRQRENDRAELGKTAMPKNVCVSEWVNEKINRWCESKSDNEKTSETRIVNVSLVPILWMPFHCHFWHFSEPVCECELSKWMSFVHNTTTRTDLQIHTPRKLIRAHRRRLFTCMHCYYDAFDCVVSW